MAKEGLTSAHHRPTASTSPLASGQGYPYLPWTCMDV